MLKPGGPDDPGVDQLLQRRSGRVVGPEVIEQLAGARRVVLQQCRPGEQRTPLPGGAAQADDLEAGQLRAPSSRLRTPAVKAVWLPPPWQAIAILVRAVSVIGTTVGEVWPPGYRRSIGSARADTEARRGGVQSPCLKARS